LFRMCGSFFFILIFFSLFVLALGCEPWRTTSLVILLFARGGVMFYHLF
jgi:hypothetical protein